MSAVLVHMYVQCVRVNVVADITICAQMETHTHTHTRIHKNTSTTNNKNYISLMHKRMQREEAISTQ